MLALLITTITFVALVKANVLDPEAATSIDAAPLEEHLQSKPSE